MSWLVMSLLLHCAHSSAQDEAHSALYDRLSPALFVIESVERVSRSKNSVGSGFAVMGGAMLATNYHVASSAVLNPEQYALRSVGSDGKSTNLEVVAVDVIHDLALLRPAPEQSASAEPFSAAALVLSLTEPAIGDSVLALGNPLDIGLSLVPGTYNGLLRREYRQHIHFTGALNPGMSGGPAVNTDGEVVGISVAGAGNSVSFLVPVIHLRQLLANLSSEPEPLDSQRERFADLIRQHQGGLINDLLAGDWTLQEFGPLMIPKEIRDYVNCRGATQERDADTRWDQSISNCTIDDRIFLSRRFDTGPMEMFFALYESADLSAFQFADLFSRGKFSPANRGGDSDLTDYECVERWTTMPNLDEQSFKASYCLRSYLDYPEVYDVLYVARGMPTASQGLHIHYTLSGVGRESALAFHDQLLGSLQWK
ncbi:MAG: serine protease [Congregibacter sp.]